MNNNDMPAARAGTGRAHALVQLPTKDTQMKNLAEIDLDTLDAVMGGAGLPLGAPDLPNVQVGRVCSTANGTFDGGAAAPVAGTWRTRQCVDAKTGTLTGSYTINQSAPARR